MSRIAIVTDSSANLPADLLAQYGIHVVPLLIQTGRETLRDGLDPLPQDFYQRILANNAPISTSAPSAGDFLRTYAALAQSVDTIISIHLSSKLSGTCQAARLASKMINGVNIEVIDSGSAAMGYGFVVLEAARVVAQGGDVQAVLQRIAEVSQRVDLIAVLSDLRYLARSGRVPSAVGLAGSLLRICPIFSLRHGEAHLIEIRRTRQRAVERMIELVARQVEERPTHAAVFHALAATQSREEALSLKEEITKRIHCVECLITEFTPVMAVHTGPDVLGVAFFTED